MMKNYIQRLVELFGHGDYSAGTRKRVQRWLSDEEHPEEKNEALRVLWREAGEQGLPQGMDARYEECNGTSECSPILPVKEFNC